MDALGVARDLGADHAGGVGVVRRAVHAADGARVEHLDLERAGRRAIVRTGRSADPDRLRLEADGLIHAAPALAPSARLCRLAAANASTLTARCVLDRVHSGQRCFRARVLPARRRISPSATTNTAPAAAAHRCSVLHRGLAEHTLQQRAILDHDVAGDPAEQRSRRPRPGSGSVRAASSAARCPRRSAARWSQGRR